VQSSRKEFFKISSTLLFFNFNGVFFRILFGSHYLITKTKQFIVNSESSNIWSQIIGLKIAIQSSKSSKLIANSSFQLQFQGYLVNLLYLSPTSMPIISTSNFIFHHLGLWVHQQKGGLPWSKENWTKTKKAFYIE
jgi:hypothetical protein